MPYDHSHTAYEFPEFPIEDLPEIPSHWVNFSWHNDVNPSFGIEDVFQVFIAESDISLREYDGFNKYYCHDSDTDCEVYHGDNWDDCLDAIIRFLTPKMGAAEAEKIVKG